MRTGTVRRSEWLARVEKQWEKIKAASPHPATCPVCCERYDQRNPHPCDALNDH